MKMGCREVMEMERGKMGIASYTEVAHTVGLSFHPCDDSRRLVIGR